VSVFFTLLKKAAKETPATAEGVGNV